MVTVRTQKEESLKALEEFKGATTQICLENEDMREGSRKSSKVVKGESLQ